MKQNTQQNTIIGCCLTFFSETANGLANSVNSFWTTVLFMTTLGATPVTYPARAVALLATISGACLSLCASPAETFPSYGNFPQYYSKV
jgi:hypothetical protein